MVEVRKNFHSRIFASFLVDVQQGLLDEIRALRQLVYTRPPTSEPSQISNVAGLYKDSSPLEKDFTLGIYQAIGTVFCSKLAVVPNLSEQRVQRISPLLILPGCDTGSSASCSHEYEA